jgi:hypothetical protein
MVKGIYILNFSVETTPMLLAELAEEAQQAGWVLSD